MIIMVIIIVVIIIVIIIMIMILIIKMLGPLPPCCGHRCLRGARAVPAHALHRGRPGRPPRQFMNVGLYRLCCL